RSVPERPRINGACLLHFECRGLHSDMAEIRRQYRVASDGYIECASPLEHRRLYIVHPDIRLRSQSGYIAAVSRFWFVDKLSLNLSRGTRTTRSLGQRGNRRTGSD